MIRIVYVLVIITGQIVLYAQGLLHESFQIIKTFIYISV